MSMSWPAVLMSCTLRQLSTVLLICVAWRCFCSDQAVSPLVLCPASNVGVGTCCALCLLSSADVFKNVAGGTAHDRAYLGAVW